MNLETTPDALQAQHHNLEQEILTEMQRPAPDELRIQELKRLKLRIKDQIALLARESA